MVSQMLQNSTTCSFIFNNLYFCSTRYIYIQQQQNDLRSNSLRSTERKLFSLYAYTNSYKDNTAFDELVAQAITQP